LAVKLRLARAGAKKAPFYRVVVSDARSPRDGRFIEIIGRYNPRTDPSTIQIDLDKANAWIAKGAQPTDVVAKLLAIAASPPTEAPTQEKKPSKKAKAKSEAAAKAAAAPAPVEEPAAVVEEPEAEPVVEEPEPEPEPAVEETADADDAPAETE